MNRHPQQYDAPLVLQLYALPLEHLTYTCSPLPGCQAPLVDLYAGENPFGGFPSVLAGCSKLQRLGLAACGLRGELAPDVGALTSLRCGGVRAST